MLSSLRHSSVLLNLNGQSHLLKCLFTAPPSFVCPQHHTHLKKIPYVTIGISDDFLQGSRPRKPVFAEVLLALFRKLSTNLESIQTDSILSTNMVYLTMTQAIVAAIQYFNQNELQEELIKDAKNADIIMMENPAVGKPIVHAQVIALSRCLRNHFQTRTKQATFTSNVPLVYHLDALLRGSRVYVEAPKPKPERVSHLTLWESKLGRSDFHHS